MWPMNTVTVRSILAIALLLCMFVLLVPPTASDYAGGRTWKILRLQLAEIEAAADLFRLDVGRYPSTYEGLEALISSPGLPQWTGPYLRTNGSILKDPWGHPFHYS